MKPLILSILLLVALQTHAQVNPIYGNWQIRSTYKNNGAFNTLLAKYTHKYNDTGAVSKYTYYTATKTEGTMSIAKYNVVRAPFMKTQGQYDSTKQELSIPVFHINSPHTHLYKIIYCNSEILILEKAKKECSKCCLK